jgi:chromosome partitioning protein
LRLAFASNKGGVGKTTLAINVASFQSQSRRMTLYDADPQRSSLHWSSIRESNNNLAIESFSEQDRYAKHAVFDCPPAIHHPDTLAVLRVADVVLIPVLPSPLDLWATLAVAEEIQRAQQDNRKLQAFLVLNQMESRSRLSRETKEVLESLEISALETTIQRRVVYRNAILDGRDVNQSGKGAIAASLEITNLIKEIQSKR